MKRQLNSPDFASTMSSTKFQPKRGTICAARYSQDNLWYRARVLRVAGKIVTIMFIDFGDEESVDTGVAGAPRLAALPKNLEGHEPVATPYRLAYVQLPPDSDDRKAALEYLTQRIGDVNIRVSPVPGPATPCGKDDNRPVHSAVVYVCSKQPNEPSGSADSASDVIDVGEELLSNGLVYMERARMPSDICVRYSEAQQSAMRGRRNIWRYGDFRDDDAA
ncbi:unnamed protein product [Mesocestoides corti]|uniref:Tudor domain-containing protein n=1 Tax=Mesocestoides corti TaxID=53468 RepID=A0A0R3ULM6_MESCO|nr:unnamed protein product [Mesocestoides corti]